MSDTLFEISVLADNARNILAMAEQSKEADNLSDEFRSALFVGIDYLHKITQLTDKVDKAEGSVA